MKGDIVVISDLHLGDARVESVQTLVIDFLESSVVADADELVIVGDCFELAQYMVREIWQRASLVIRTLALVAKRVPTTFVIGNHDLWLKEFCGEYSFRVTYPSYVTEQRGKRIYFEHGHRYQAEYIRNPSLYNALAAAGRLLDYLPPEVEDVGGSLFLKLKELARRQPLTSEKTGSALNVDLDEFMLAAQRLLNKGYTCVLFGHTHKPLVHSTNRGFYVNTGDWVTHRTYTVLREGVPLQREWNSAVSESVS